MVQKLTQVEDIPASPGAYGLLIRLEEPLALKRALYRGYTLDPGQYLYAGSANGPGGLRARVSRHLRRDKKLHWHVDDLTKVGHTDTVLLVPNGSECEIIQLATKSGSVSQPVPGFGSSDCNTCLTHLLKLEEQFVVPEFAQIISASLVLTAS